MPQVLVLIVGLVAGVAVTVSTIAAVLGNAAQEFLDAPLLSILMTIFGRDG